jgi:hypothetical protein
MEKIKKEDLPAILPVRRGRDTRLRTVLMQLEIGEGAFLPVTEWKRKKSFLFRKKSSLFYRNPIFHHVLH